MVFPSGRTERNAGACTPEALGESVKVLSVADGEAVFTGGKHSRGVVLCAGIDGTRGYVFSNTMVLYEKKKARRRRHRLFARAKRFSARHHLCATMAPAYYQIMVDDSTIDPDLFILRYASSPMQKFAGPHELPGYQAFQFYLSESVGDWLVFEGSKLRIRFENESTIVADWSDTDQILADEGWAQGGRRHVCAACCLDICDALW
jgi:hypothetical protein